MKIQNEYLADYDPWTAEYPSDNNDYQDELNIAYEDPDDEEQTWENEIENKYADYDDWDNPKNWYNGYKDSKY